MDAKKHRVTLLLVLALVIAAVLIAVGAGRYVKAYSDRETKSELEVARLKTQLASIQRRAGHDAAINFDVTKLFVPQEHARDLGNAYASVGNGALFFIAPTAAGLAYDTLSESDLAALRFDPHASTGLNMMHGAAAGERNIHVWRQKDSMSIVPTPKEDMAGLLPGKLAFFPMISVQILDQVALKNMSVAIAGMLDEDKPSPKSAAASNASLTDIRKLINQVDGNSPDTPARSQVLGLSEKPASPQAPMSADAKVKMEDLLTNLYRGDMAVIMLQSLIMGSLQLPVTLADTTIALNQIEKKGNVLYVQLSVQLASVKVAGQATPINLTLNKEVFFVGMPGRMVLIQAEVPSTGSQSTAYSWINQWLDSIRIPI